MKDAQRQQKQISRDLKRVWKNSWNGSMRSRTAATSREASWVCIRTANAAALTHGSTAKACSRDELPGQHGGWLGRGGRNGCYKSKSLLSVSASRWIKTVKSN